MLEKVGSRRPSPITTPLIVWYSFVVRTSDLELRCGAAQGRTGGEGVTYDYAEVPSFQITVYRHRETRPTWYEHGMVYQIFPDRYRRDPQWRERCEKALAEPHNGIPRRIVEDWNEPPVYERAEDGSIASWDMYGGSLKGITGDLDRLAEMGVTAIYLNPIFKAASNHRYDTADYLTIDPMLGTEEDFRELCHEAEQRNMSIILDGVFNHTGDDSIYFNRYYNYPEPGAWQGPESRWRDAYCFNEDGTYRCWWGIENMPDLNQSSPLVRELLLGEDGVIRRWTRAGAHGWRLDVADELQESLIGRYQAHPFGREIRRPPARRGVGRRIQQDQLRQTAPLPAWLRARFCDELPVPRHGTRLPAGTMSAADAVEAIEALHENYPPEALACCLNLLGSHDRPRIASLLGGGPDESKLPEEERGRWRLSPDAMGLAKGRFWLATLMQMTFPGVPSIYYGDEYCLEGLSDPGNRRTLPLEKDIYDRDMQDILRNASAIRRALPCMVDGTISAWVPEGSDDDVLAYTRRGSDGSCATVLVNRSLDRTHTVRIPALDEAATDVISGSELSIDEQGSIEMTLWPFGSAVAYFHPEHRLQKPLETGAGVLCHITSLPTGTNRPGTLGAPARRFIDHLAAMGCAIGRSCP